MRRIVSGKLIVVLGLALLFSAAVPGGQPQPICSPGAPPAYVSAGAPSVVESVPASWVAGAPFPSTLVRAAGVWHPGIQRFYVMGGRAFDGGGGELTTPYEYDPVANTWTAKAALWPDTYVNNMAAAVLIGSNGWCIYTVGGSSSTVPGCTADVRVYEPFGDTLSVLASDPWPGNPGGDTLPGGWAVFNNKLYIFGGFSSSLVAVFGDIWQFDPLAAPTWKWTKMTATLPVNMGYIPATTIGSKIYIGGGAVYPGVLLDTTYSYRYDPVVDTITTITSIPRATSNTRAVNQGGQMWVLGGNWNNASNEVDAYNPGLATWSIAPPMATARRNFAADIDPATGRIFAVGGYLLGGGVDNTMEIYTPCTSPPPVPTITPGGPTTFCAGGSVTLTSSAASGNQWIKDGLDIPGETGTTYVAMSSGKYTVRATDSNGCSSTSWVTTITVRTTGPEAWNSGASFPTAVVRASGVFFPPNGRFYVLGGRSADGTGNDLPTLFEYDPIDSTWTAMGIPVGVAGNNMAAGFLIGPNGPTIYTVGGSIGGSISATSHVRAYDPIKGTMEWVVSDMWPPAMGLDVLPGGAAVYDNMLYVFGGFNSNLGQVYGDIWRFDPMAAPGAKWTKMTATLPVALGYIPAATIGSYIYLAGGSEYIGGLLTDTTYSYRYDPVADVITTIAPIPRATSNTVAVTQNGRMWVLGGTFGGASNEVDVYDPATDSWSLGPSLTDVRRNFPADVDPATGRIFVVGGYDPSVPTNTMEIYSPALGPISLTPPTLPTAAKSQPYAVTISANPPGVYTYAVTSGTLPPGLTLNPVTGVLSGTPTTSNAYSFTITATAPGTGCSFSQAYTIAVYLLLLDDTGRTKLCLNTTTGAFQWQILSGPGSPFSYPGVAQVLNAGTLFKMTAGPYTFYMTLDPYAKRAKGYLYRSVPYMYSSLSDTNWTNNVGGCS
jgi:hypothetical protein